MFDGFVTVAIGLVILAITTGVVGFGVVWQIITLWPVLLIAIGLDLLGKAMHTSWVRALGSVVVIAALAYAVAINVGSVSGMTRSRGRPRGARSEISRAGRARCSEAQLDLDAGVAEVNLDVGHGTRRGPGRLPVGNAGLLESTARAPSAEVDLTLGEADDVVIWPGGSKARDSTRSLPTRVLWDMQLEHGRVHAQGGPRATCRSARSSSSPASPTARVTLGDVPAEVDEAEAVVKSGISSVVHPHP